MAIGRVILLNGTSSSGKTSLAKALQTLVSTPEEPFYHVEGDVLRAMHPAHTPLKTAAMPRLLSAIPASLAVLAAHGNSLIIDDTFGEAQLLNYAKAFAPVNALFVGVRCPLAVLEAREIARGDRKPGTAKELDTYCHKHGLYDLEVDTSRQTPEEAAQYIAHHFATTPATALRRLLGAHQGTS